MDGSSTDNNITAKFTSNAAYLLASHTSPSLAALHAHRAAVRSHSPLTLTPLHCPRCAHAPISTRVAVANSSKQSTRRTLTSSRETNNADAKKKRTRRSGTRRNNKTHSVQSGKSESSSSPSSPRGSRVRIIGSCAACGYLGEQAFERSELTCENNERCLRSARPSADLDDVLASPSEPVSSRPATPALAKETGTRSSTPIESSAKLKVKQAQAVATARTGTTMAQPEPPIVSSPSSSTTAAVAQSRSAIKRQKKKAGLQDLLARSKQQKQSKPTKDQGQDGGGLVAFLSDL